ncbi:MAG: glycosyltransferase [Rhodobacterales bacterium]|nr:glycosyltransferase [Rhodobacterales bacterium]
MSLRIAQVCRVGWPKIGGMETVVHELSRVLNQRGHDAQVFTLQRSPSAERTWLPAGVHQGVHYHRLPRVGPVKYPFALGIRRAVQDFDLVHVHGLDGFADVLVGGAVPVGVSTHGGFLHTERHRWLKRLTLRTLTRRTLGLADAVWFTSATDRRALSPTRATGSVLPDGLALSEFLSQKRRPKPNRFVVPGRVDANKGIDDLLKLLGPIRRSLPDDWQLDVLGPGHEPDIAALQKLAADQGLAQRVVFHRGVPRRALLEALATCHHAILPSRYEGFGLALVECMAAGVPVIASAITPHRDRMDGTGTCIELRRPRAGEKLLQALLQPSGNDIEARRASRVHDWSNRVLAYEDAYRTLVAG